MPSSALASRDNSCGCGDGGAADDEEDDEEDEAEDEKPAIFSLRFLLMPAQFFEIPAQSKFLPPLNIYAAQNACSALSRDDIVVCTFKRFACARYLATQKS